MKSLLWLIRLLWYGLGLYLVLIYLQAVVVPAVATTRTDPLGMVRALLGLVLLVAFFLLIHAAMREVGASWAEEEPPPRKEPPPGVRAFPSTDTLVVGIWLLITTGGSLLALLLCFHPPTAWTAWGSQHFSGSGDSIQEALIMLFAAGVGSSITAILGYLDHASVYKDFDRAFMPWYVGRPLMGMLLGLIFYFVLKGGLWTVTPSGGTPVNDLNDFALAGIGALVGLFSKNAIEKLRELFQVLFRTEEGMAKQAQTELLASLPESLRQQVREHLPGPKPESGGGAVAEVGAEDEGEGETGTPDEAPAVAEGRVPEKEGEGEGYIAESEAADSEAEDPEAEEEEASDEGQDVR